ncbi:acyl carrier protein [Salinarimonas chemoclinalis]|uniref:acyl carrier protein n=1 Tax=Salinarimonas chemoclinalis TaxID=3241599 RepID=UPI0035590833
MTKDATAASAGTVRATILDEVRALLKCEEAGPEDHFMDLGGDSLTAPILAGRIEAAFGTRPELEEVLGRSLGDLADIVAARAPKR